ncbi:uncharacterized protein [Lepisosteus oculatus]|uniref:uncharacterized protein isoform X2 n=1 Tax=Lepisosteus oculatus TaxID=7918 RepID=UPI0035F5075F
MGDLNLGTALLLLCACTAESHLKGSTLMAVRAGDVVTLPCNHQLYHETTWLIQRPDDTLHVVVLANKNPGKNPFTYTKRPDSRFSLVLNPSTASPDLRIENITETDQGLYYCAARDRGEIQIGKGTRLQTGSLEKEREPQHPEIGLPCLIVLLSAVPLSALASSCCVLFILLRGRGIPERRGQYDIAVREEETSREQSENLNFASQPRRPRN